MVSVYNSSLRCMLTYNFKNITLSGSVSVFLKFRPKNSNSLSQKVILLSHAKFLKINPTFTLAIVLIQRCCPYIGANYLQSVFWTYFEKKFWISIKILSLWKFLSKYWISTKKFVEVQYIDKKFNRSPVFWDLEFLWKS